ncbi:MAG: hypothetical protein CL526_08310 [Aequorivita sp.]|nr:hypothetical protein [Aequorivita sp.]|tara:strand:- start:14501 stop:15499 length:999 start_codon:yes stop_codon:yes gene_type:complete
MENAKKIVYTILYIIAVVLLLGTLLSLLRNEEIRYIKMLDFPRIQFFILAFVVLLLLMATVEKQKWYHYAALGGLVIAMLINGRYIVNYTSLVGVDVPSANNVKASDNNFSLLIANVKMSNRISEPTLEIIKEKKPDIVLAMETDSWWNDKLQPLQSDYPYVKKVINDVTYGMILYSKLPLNSIDVNYYTNDKVPSFESKITLRNGKVFTLHTMHPVPPTHFKRLPDNENEEENALQILGRKVKNRALPTVVAGDLNDVVWSYVDILTHTENILKDVRVGRGFYNTFNAENFLLRWPLDHVFVTEEFKLVNIERLRKIGSDHFPLFVELTIE